MYVHTSIYVLHVYTLNVQVGTSINIIILLHVLLIYYVNIIFHVLVLLTQFVLVGTT